MYEYQKYNSYFAQTAGKMEELCEDELLKLGADKTNLSYRGVNFSADTETLYRINYMTRLSTNIYAPLLTFNCHSDRYLKNTASKINWLDFMGLQHTFSISANVSNSKIKHSKYASLCLKDAIADYFRDKMGKRPDVNVNNPDVSFNLRINNNRATISLNLSGESLHKRGYRQAKGKAPMQETLAAAIIKLSRWNGEKKLYDPFCGSGTILIEALMHYCNIPSGYLRENFGFFNLPDFDKKLWDTVKKGCDGKIRSLPENLIFGSDKSNQAVQNAIVNVKNLPGGDKINFSVKSFDESSNFENGVIITNPPHGIRMQNKLKAQELIKQFGDFLKNKCKHTTAYIFVGDKELRKHVGLKTTRKIPLVSGSLDGRLLQIDIY